MPFTAKGRLSAEFLRRLKPTMKKNRAAVAGAAHSAGRLPLAAVTSCEVASCFDGRHLDLDQPAGIDQAGDLHHRPRWQIGLLGVPKNCV